MPWPWRTRRSPPVGYRLVPMKRCVRRRAGVLAAFTAIAFTAVTSATAAGTESGEATPTTAAGEAPADAAVDSAELPGVQTGASANSGSDVADDTGLIATVLPAGWTVTTAQAPFVGDLFDNVFTGAYPTIVMTSPDGTTTATVQVVPIIGDFYLAAILGDDLQACEVTSTRRDLDAIDGVAVTVAACDGKPDAQRFVYHGVNADLGYHVIVDATGGELTEPAFETVVAGLRPGGGSSPEVTAPTTIPDETTTAPETTAAPTTAAPTTAAPTTAAPTTAAPTTAAPSAPALLADGLPDPNPNAMQPLWAYGDFLDVPQLGEEADVRGSGCGGGGQLGTTMPDGLWIGFVVNYLDTVDIDVVCVYYSEEADRVRAEQTDDIPDNDDTILIDDGVNLLINNSNTLRTATPSPNLILRDAVVDAAGNCVEGPAGPHDAALSATPAWIRIDQGQVTWIYYGCSALLN